MEETFPRFKTRFADDAYELRSQVSIALPVARNNLLGLFSRCLKSFAKELPQLRK